jgi:antitoxin (DNA-binding transcriptional repressor) of toxin-antitoxin stability system
MRRQPPRLSGVRSAALRFLESAQPRLMEARMQPICHNSARPTMPQSAKMPSITLSQLRDTKRLLAWLRAGKTVELRERNRVIAHIVPVKEDDSRKAQDSSGGNPSRKLMRDLEKILRRVDRFPVLDDRSPDEIIGYDKDGLPH